MLNRKLSQPFGKNPLRIRWTLVSLIVLAFGINACTNQSAMPGRAFEGTITQVIKVPGIAELGRIRSGDTTGIDSMASGVGSMIGAAATTTLKMYAREDKIAYEMSMLGGMIKARSIIDRSSRKLTMLLPGNQAIVTDLRQVMDTMRSKIDDTIRKHQKSFDSIADALPKPTGKKETINGMEAEEYTGKMQGLDVTMWITQDPRMKFYDIMRDAILGRARTGQGGLEELFDLFAPLTSNGKFPLKFEATYRGKTMISSEVVDIDENKVDDAMFQIPKEYHIISGDSARRERHIDTTK